MGELDAMKREINLTAYAAGQGYALDKRASSRNSALMRKGADKVVVALGYTGQWIYFSVRDDRDNGTIVDFVQHRRGGSLGDVRKELRPWLRGHSVPVRSYVPKLEPLKKDRQDVLAAWCRLREERGHPYLTGARGLPADLLEGERFAGTVHRDGYDNACFVHRDREGVCGFEIKNAGFTGFAKHGTKGLWFSNAKAGDTALVIAETAIDALSFAALHPDPHARYCSVAGQLNPSQPDLLAGAMARMPEGAAIIAATDHDEAGSALAGKLRAVFERVGRTNLRFAVQAPAAAGADWNDVLRARAGAHQPEGQGAARGEASRGGADPGLHPARSPEA